jgi:hypothetical protein
LTIPYLADWDDLEDLKQEREDVLSNYQRPQRKAQDTQDYGYPSWIEFKDYIGMKWQTRLEM